MFHKNQRKAATWQHLPQKKKKKKEKKKGKVATRCTFITLGSMPLN